MIRFTLRSIHQALDPYYGRWSQDVPIGYISSGFINPKGLFVENYDSSWCYPAMGWHRDRWVPPTTEVLSA